MTSWWNDKLMKWQVDEMTSLMKKKVEINDKLIKYYLIKCSVDITRCQVDEMVSWTNAKCINWYFCEMASWWTVKLKKLKVDEMAY